jgi:iron complex outermembrane recepter protein
MRLSVAVSVSVLSMSGFSIADASEDGLPESVEEVVVTAQKREQSVVDVPISISVLGTQELEARRVINVNDYVLSVPNATIFRSALGNPAVSLRGVSAGLQGGQFEPIAITIDDISLGATDSRSVFFAQAFDIERIEVLRGPQGTLTGASSLGGTINIITAKPDPSGFAAKGVLDYSRFDTRLAKATVNIPLADALALRTTAYGEQSDGAIRNVGPAGGGSDYENYGVRAALRWMPASALTLDFSAGYERQDRHSDPSIGIDRYLGGAATRNARINQITALGGNYFDVDFIQDVGTNGGVIRTDVPDERDMITRIATFHGRYDLDRHHIDLIYGHYDFKLWSRSDNDSSEYASSAISRVTVAPRGIDTDSVELRFSSRYEGALNWVAGATYVDEIFADYGFSDRGDNQLAGSYRFGIEFANRRTLQTSAAFGNLFWDFAERWHLSAGLRASSVKTTFGSTTRTVANAVMAPIVTRDAKLTEVTPRIALNFDLTPDVTAYVQYATGYRPGYGNNSEFAGRHETTLGVIDVPAVVDAERARNYEIGMKGTLFDHRVAFSSAVFYMDYSNLQAFGGNVLDNPSGEVFGFDLNAGSARTRGFELEASARPLTGLELRTAVGYVDSKVKSLLVSGTTLRDVDVPVVRPWTSTFTVSYEHALTERLRGHIRGDYLYQTRTFSNFDKDPATELPEFGRADFSLGVAGERWTATAYIQNAFDEIYWVGIAGNTGLHGSRANFIPRTWGVRFTVDFGANP